MKARWKSGCLALMACFLLSTPAQARDRYTMAVLPFRDSRAKPDGRVKNPDALVTSKVVEMLERYRRFDVLSGTELTEALTRAGLKLEETGAAKLADVAVKLNRRVVIYGDLLEFKLEKRVEEMVLFTRHALVCTIRAAVKVHDREDSGPAYSETFSVEGAVFGTRTEIEGAMPMAGGKKGKAVEDAIKKMAERIRKELVKRYKMVGQVTAVEDKTITLDIGSNFGVHKGDFFGVYTGGGGKRTAVVKVTEVKEHSSKARLHQGEAAIEVGTEVRQVFRR